MNMFLLDLIYIYWMDVGNGKVVSLMDMVVFGIGEVIEFTE